MNAIKIRDVVSYVVFGLIIAVVLFYFGSLGLRVGAPSNRTNLSMDVPEINGLVPDSNVLLRGVPVGKVTKTSTDTNSASVDFWVDGKYQIPVDTQVELQNLSALGESYIQLVPRSDGGPVLTNNQRISTESVVAPASVTELAATATRILNQLEPGALQRIIAEADVAFPDPVRVLPNLSRTATLFNNMLNGLNGEGRVLLSNFGTLIRNSEWISPDLTAFTPNVTLIGVYWQDFFKHLGIQYSRDGPDNQRQFNHLLDRVQGLLDTNGGDLKVLGEAFQPKLNAIAATLMNFDSGQILDNFLNQVPADGMITLRVRP
ncbi:mammalian cell entry protein [Mycobacterium sp. Root135]|uniref:MlaD family protein n=1 Tax=Mycobacterium sp. Root135 TaxID=1736457 RepID=UPI000700F35D|nr:MlaD family protein [Mycobacterium sp. Root135]KQY08944.1 mammalian cell entry protein [Mycobacterium sp. Root135]